jgi:alpha-beta hydrolase superfamily lysophospholipase
MAESTEITFAGKRGTIVARQWPLERPRYLALLSHGYGEHIGRYEHVADTLNRHGAAVYGPDHRGHGRSAGERVLIEDYDEIVTDLRLVAERAGADHPGVPVVLIGHSMGGLIAARYAQRHRDDLAALVLSGPVIGEWELVGTLLAAEEMPDTPLDTTTLSRDPSVGAAYTADPLIWHGPFKRATIQGVARMLETIGASGDLGTLPVLWAHGADDALVPAGGSRIGVEALAGTDLTERIYPGARHEIFNEINKDEVLADVTAFADRVLAAR